MKNDAANLAQTSGAGWAAVKVHRKERRHLGPHLQPLKMAAKRRWTFALRSSGWDHSKEWSHRCDLVRVNLGL